MNNLEGNHSMKHVLVVGGTGMLADVVSWYANQSNYVSVIAREEEKVKRIKHSTKQQKHIYPIYVNYRQIEKLEEQLKTAILMLGLIQQVVAWVRSDAKETLKSIIKVVTDQLSDWQLFHIINSSADSERIKDYLYVPANCQYRQIQLGFKVVSNYSRWLTNQEISQGVIEGIQQERNTMLHIVGQVEPSDK